MNINKFAANQLADARYKSGLSLSDLAAKTGMSVPTLSRLLSGKLKSVSLDNYLTVLHACGQSEKPYIDALLRHVKRSRRA